MCGNSILLLFSFSPSFKYLSLINNLCSAIPVMPPLSVALRSLFTLFSLHSFILFLYFSLDCPTFFSLTISLPFPLLFSFLSLLFSYLSLSFPSPAFFPPLSLPFTEAIQHMIIRKNYGCTHFIIGRDMAGCKSSLDGTYMPPLSLPSLLPFLSLFFPPYIPLPIFPLSSSRCAQVYLF